MAEEQNNPEENQAEAAPAKKSRLPLILIALVVLGGAGAGGWYFLMAPDGEAETAAEAEPEEEAHGDPIYFTLADNLVVNFRSPGGTRFLQVGIDLMTFDEEGVYALEQHAPVLQSNLIFLLSDQSQESLLSREGKEALRDEALAEVQHSMEELHGSPVVESLYFTSFVMQ